MYIIKTTRKKQSMNKPLELELTLQNKKKHSNGKIELRANKNCTKNKILKIKPKNPGLQVQTNQ